MYYVYILRLSSNNDYIGFSSDLRMRIKEHAAGRVKGTRIYRPVRLIFYAGFISKKKALDFEQYLKSSSGFAFRKKRLT